jgi:hypothetical protein
MLGWMQHCSDGDIEQSAAISTMATMLATLLAECIQTILFILQNSLDDHTDHGSGHFVPETVQLKRSTQAGERCVPFRLMRAATDRQHLKEWLAAADYAATALVTLLSSVTLTSGYMSGTAGALGAGVEDSCFPLEYLCHAHMLA